MKPLFSFLVFYLLLIGCSVSKPLKSKNTQLTEYLVNNVILKEKTSGNLVLIPLSANEIPKDNPTRELQYWDIIGKYYKGMSREEMKNIINHADWLDKPSNINYIHLYYPTQMPVTTDDYKLLDRRFKSAYIFFVSNPLYSKDGNTCILFVQGYQQGAYTVEITKDESGKWAWSTISGEWIE
jgi:hypothetical protein